jgi:hypothetical protein
METEFRRQQGAGEKLQAAVWSCELAHSENLYIVRGGARK